MRAVLDTTVLIGEDAPVDIEGRSASCRARSCTSASLWPPTMMSARRTDRLAAVEATFDPLPVTPEVARTWGRLAADVERRGGLPRRRQIDLAIAATASAERVPLLTLNIADLVDARRP